MEKNLVVVISTAEREKALAGLVYAGAAMKNKWFGDVKVFFFGPFEKLLAEDAALQEKAAELAVHGAPMACKFIADNSGVSDKLLQLGYQVDYTGAPLSAYISQGYVPLVF